MVELDKEEKKALVQELMEKNGLKGASKKRLIRFLGERYNWDRHKVEFRLKRALLAERYAKGY